MGKVLISDVLNTGFNFVISSCCLHLSSLSRQEKIDTLRRIEREILDIASAVRHEIKDAENGADEIAAL